MTTSSHLHQRPFGRALVGAPTGSESADFDRFAIQDLGVPEATLMENAGRSAAMVLQELYPSGRVTAIVGPGNNGGDALVLLRNLAAWGRTVTAIIVGEREDDEALLHGWDIDTVRDIDFQGDAEQLRKELLKADVLVDGVLGTGISGAPREPQASAIRALNHADAPTFALDIPSGVDAASGAVPGEAVEAEVTVSFGGAKLGTLLHPGRKRVGRLVVVEIGFPPVRESTFRGTLITPAWASARRPRREPDTHKNAVGALLMVAGHPGMAGAAIMSARSALRAGAGFVRIASPPSNRAILQGAVPEAVYVDSTDGDAFRAAMEASRAFGVGPGLGTGKEGKASLVRILEAGGSEPLLLDADALNLIAKGEAPSLKEIGSRRPVIITPHPGEMARLTGLGIGEITSERPRVARDLAEATGCAVLLKGMPSLVASPEGRIWIDTVATSDLATAGMGDVLSGAISGFLAQGSDPVEAAALGLHTSGRAAVRTGFRASLIPEDVVEALPGALREEGPGDTDLKFPFVLFDQDPAR